MSDYRARIILDSDIAGAEAAKAALDRLNAAGQNTANYLARTSRESTGLDAMATRTGYARQAFMGMELAAKGNATAVFGLAQAFRALGLAIKANPLMLLITIATAAYSVINRLTERHNEAAKASLDAANKTAEYTDQLRQLREQSQQVSFSLEKQQKALQNLGAYYDYAAAAADKYADAQKRSAHARISLELAGVDLEEARAILAAGGDKTKEEQIRLATGGKRSALEMGEKKGELIFDASAIERKIQQTREAMRDLQKQQAAVPAVAAAESNLAELIAKRDAARQDPKKFNELTSQIEKQKGIVASLIAEEKERLASISQQIEAKNTLLLTLEQDLADNQNLQAVLDKQLETAKAKLDLQGRLNAAQEKELAIQEKKAAAEKKLADAQKSGEQQLAAAREKEKKLAGEADEKKKLVMSPAYRRAKEDEARQAEREEKRWASQVKMAKEAEGREGLIDRLTGRGGTAGRDRILDAEKARIAAADAKRNREWLESQVPANISAMRIALDQIKSDLQANLQIK